MIQHYVDMIIGYIEHGSLAIVSILPLIVFLTALFESTPVIGTLTPGTLFLLLFGYASFVNGSNLGVIILMATAGGVLGDLIGYTVGKYAGGWLVKHKKILKEVHIEQGRGFFSKHGGKSIFIGRFVGPIRPIVPLIAGSIGMNIRRFLFWNILSAFLWATLYVSVGYFFGTYARSIEAYVSKVSLIVTVFVLILIYVIYKKTKHKK